jgi:hypothetical protein
MADPLTMAAVGAVAGAAMNRDDPMKGALMGAALGGAGGYGYGALTGAGAAGTAAGGASLAEGAIAADALPASLQGLPLGPTGRMPVDVAAMQASPLATMSYYAPSEVATLDAALGNLPTSSTLAASPSAFQYPDVDAIARASMGSDLPGLASGASGSSPYIVPQRMSFANAAGLLAQAQPRAQAQAPGVKRGEPRSVNYGGFASLLEPKLVERRRVSLI